MLYTFLGVVVIGSFLTFGSVYMLRVNAEKDPKKKELLALHMVQRRLRAILRVTRVKYTVIGEENIPDNEAVLFVANHRSFFDVIIGYNLVKGPTAFIAKKEIEKFTTLKIWMEYLHCQFMDRNNMKQSLKVIINAIRLIKEGTSVYIYPEGTRSKTDDPKEMLPFKEGSFRIAEKSGCKIIPVAMIRTRDIFEAQFPRVKPQHVYVRIGTPIEIIRLTEDEKEHIGAYTRGVIISYIAELEKKAAEEN